MDALEILRGSQLALFVALGTLSVILAWRRHRRPSTYLALAFASLAAALTMSRFVDPGEGIVAQRFHSAVVLLGLLVFPWAVAAMAWSFRGRLPTWLRATVPVLGLVAVLSIVVEPAEADATPGTPYLAYVALVAAVWTALSGAAAVMLWRSRGRQTLVRQRLQLMVAGLVTLNVALLVAVLGVGRDVTAIDEVAAGLSIVSAFAFVAGFAPPRLLRVWWRRDSTERFARMQQALIGAATPTEVARAVAPMLSELVGGGVAVIGRDGEVTAASHLTHEQLASDRARLLAGDRPADAQVVPVNGYWLVVRATPHTPVFGQGERELVDSFAIQLRLALERAELFEAHLEARAAAEAARQELETTLMGLSHDLKSPTAAIAGFADLLDGASGPQERAELVEQVRISTRYLEELVDALFEFSKVGRTQLDVQPVELAATLRSVVRRISATSAGLTVDVVGDLPVVLANPVRMEQVFDNLIGNAIKHGGRADLSVVVTARSSDDEVVLEVRDDGQGFDVADAERIFALFVRGAGASRTGSGVGLGMVRRILESYGGSIVADASGPGAAFEIRLPMDLVVTSDWSRDHHPKGSVAGRSATE